MKDVTGAGTPTGFAGAPNWNEGVADGGAVCAPNWKVGAAVG